MQIQADLGFGHEHVIKAYEAVLTPTHLCLGGRACVQHRASPPICTCWVAVRAGLLGGQSVLTPTHLCLGGQRGSRLLQWAAAAGRCGSLTSCLAGRNLLFLTLARSKRFPHPAVMEMAAGGSLTSYVADKWQKAQAQGLFLSEDEARFFFKARRVWAGSCWVLACWWLMLMVDPRFVSRRAAVAEVPQRSHNPSVGPPTAAWPDCALVPTLPTVLPCPLLAAIPVGGEVLPQPLCGAPRPEARQHAAGQVRRLFFLAVFVCTPTS